MGTIHAFIIVNKLRSLLFGLNCERVLALQSENADLCFKVKMLELQLGTLKRRKEESERSNLGKIDQLKAIFFQLEKEICQLIIERQKVFDRISVIYSLISLLNSIIS